MNKLWKVLAVVLVVCIVAGGGYALYQVGRARGHVEGLAENVGPENLETYFAENFSARFIGEGGKEGSVQFFEHGGMSPFMYGGSYGRRAPSPILCLVPLLFFGGMIALVVWLIRRKRKLGGHGWQLTYSPRKPEAEDTPSED